MARYSSEEMDDFMAEWKSYRDRGVLSTPAIPLTPADLVLLGQEEGIESVLILDLAGNDICDDGAGALALLLSKLTSLTSLDLSNNEIGDAGVSALAPVLAKATHLTHLNLCRNHITHFPPFLDRLTPLQQLDVSDNRLTVLTLEIGRLPNLKWLNVRGNPLPAELLRLGEGTELIAYLRALVADGEQRRPEAAPRMFNEAKLLLVGPGDVGKTWLLQALQGKTPRKNQSTKGIEIAREPLDVTHPSDASRTLHLNCWDFGGQDHYQVTHQIFFSRKAIYLLVWKPRVGIDPDLAARLDRIELSAGKTAKVFIVSTHADANVPARIGEEALREKYGHLIAGFFEVDSKNGPKGTGIAELKTAVATAAAQLDGMDVEYPAPWHEARIAIRKLQKFTITHAEFCDICRKSGMTDDSAHALAIIMDEQGHAVYFADASAGSDARVDDGQNLIVLDPEWLAKAVAFVIEDAPTTANSGILRHDRLKVIWKKDAKRPCPGYKRDVHGYLLWLMWEFDIAYRMDEQTSLIPELIQRNRPDADEIMWLPNSGSPSGERQVTLLCRIDQPPPPGLVPVLTAAVHPLRRVQGPAEKKDNLDRNWRDGFFLETERRGTAFVELRDRVLWIAARHDYPAQLAGQIRSILDAVIKDPFTGRWPNLAYDFAVPCIGRTNSGPCKGSFKLAFLQEWRGAKIACDKCGSRAIDVNLMLEGLDENYAELLRRVASVTAGQVDLMAVALGLYRDVLDPARSELERAPNLFTIVPEKGGWNLLARATQERVRVSCWCEHPDQPHPCVPIGSNEPPEYLLTSPQKWLLAIAPYISWTAKIAKAFIPLAGAVVEDGLRDVLTGDVKEQIELMSKASATLYSGDLDVGRREQLHSMDEQRPEIVALRHIHDALLEQVPQGRRWGDLRPVRTKAGKLLWLCAKHAAIQQPPVPRL